MEWGCARARVIYFRNDNFVACSECGYMRDEKRKKGRDGRRQRHKSASVIPLRSCEREGERERERERKHEGGQRGRDVCLAVRR